MQGQRVLSAVMEYFYHWPNHQISQDLFCILNTKLIILVGHSQKVDQKYILTIADLDHLHCTTSTQMSLQIHCHNAAIED